MCSTTTTGGPFSLASYFGRRRRPSWDDDDSINSEAAVVLADAQVPAMVQPATEAEVPRDDGSWTSAVSPSSDGYSSDSASVYSQDRAGPLGDAVPEAELLSAAGAPPDAQAAYSPAAGHTPVEEPAEPRPRSVCDIPRLIRNTELEWDVSRDDLAGRFRGQARDRERAVRELGQVARTGSIGRHNGTERARGLRKLYLRLCDCVKAGRLYRREKKKLRAWTRELRWRSVEAQVEMRKSTIESIFTAADEEIKDGDSLFGTELNEQLMQYLNERRGVFMPLRSGLLIDTDLNVSKLRTVLCASKGKQVVSGPGGLEMVCVYRVYC